MHKPARSFSLTLGSVVAAIAFASIGSSVHAVPISYAGTLEIIGSPFSGELEVGDRFDFGFTYDDAATDSEAAADIGYFVGALTAFSLARQPTNAGTWDPAGATFSLPFSVATSDQTLPAFDVFGFNIAGSGFPTLGGFPFYVSGLGFSAVGLVTDTGLGQTLDAQLGGALPGTLASFGFAGGDFLVSGSSDYAVFTVISFSRVQESSDIPEPAALTVLALGGLGLLARRRGQKGAHRRGH